MEKKFNKIGAISIGVFLILGIAYAFYGGNELSKNYKVTIGRVTEITSPGWKSSGDYSILYEFEANYKKYSNNTNLNYCGDLRKPQIRHLIINKLFPIAYNPNTPSFNVMILSQKTAKRFDYKIPDTLLPYFYKLSCGE